VGVFRRLSRLSCRVGTSVLTRSQPGLTKWRVGTVGGRSPDGRSESANNPTGPTPMWVTFHCYAHRQAFEARIGGSCVRLGTAESASSMEYLARDHWGHQRSTGFLPVLKRTRWCDQFGFWRRKPRPYFPWDSWGAPVHDSLQSSGFQKDLVAPMDGP